MTQNAFNLFEQYLSERNGDYKIQNTKECCICFDETHHRTYQCDHFICPGCHFDLYKHTNNQLKCPLCRRKFTDIELPMGHEFIGLIAFGNYTKSIIRQKIDTILKNDISDKDKTKEMIELEKYTVLHFTIISSIISKDDNVGLTELQEYVNTVCYL
jgi:hypothetical protein